MELFGILEKWKIEKWKMEKFGILEKRKIEKLEH